MGLTVLDAGVVIAILDAGDMHHAAASKALTDARDQGDALVIPVPVHAECLVSPSRSGPATVATVDRFLDALPARVEPATRAIGAAAASLRVAHGPSLRLPDAPWPRPPSCSMQIASSPRTLGGRRSPSGSR